MKVIRTSTGPFAERPFYRDEVIDAMCSDALAETGFLPSTAEPIRIDRFIEKRFNVRIIYEELSNGVLGFTEFGSNGVEAVHVAQPSEKTRPAERRVNSTLAHEGGHGLMHAHLFALNLDHKELFERDADVTQRRILCRDGEERAGLPRPSRKYDGRWWELQANRAIGGLLMPKELFLRFMNGFLRPSGKLGLAALPADRREEAVRAVAEAFDVNPAAARIRVDMFFPSTTRQLTL
jgi:hypothetical protein